jgi:hypothetical protein
MSGGIMREALTLMGPAGRIEALLEGPASASPRAVAVICHPHPQHQGTMLNKVVHTLSRSMNDVDVPAIRFNFRGVGASEGAYADGYGETDDLVAVASWARARYPGAALWLAGFSFGAAVSIRAAAGLGPALLISVAPPTSRLARLLDGAEPECRWLVVQGEADRVVASSDVMSWVASLPSPPELALLPDVDHFFHGRLTVLRNTVVEFLRRIPAA